MKKIFKYLTAAAFTGAMVFTSCETLELEELTNPNALSADQADPALLLNTVQLAYRNNINQFGFNGSRLTRIELFNQRDYFTGLTGGTLNFSWSNIYAGMIPDVAAIEALNDASSTPGALNYAEGVGKALLGHSLLLLVDYIGDVPFSQTNQPLEFPNPVVDSGESVYAEALALLDEASELIGDNAGTDLYYSDAGKWQKFINTVRLKAAITTQDYGTFDNIISNNNYISDVEDDLQWQYGTQEVNPDERHPDYAANYTPSGTGTYMSNWLMNTMNESDDPRIRYYYARQTDCTPGASCNPDGNGETISCSLETPPPHYVAGGYVFCSLEDGYWGRDHGDDDGAPPDEFLKTTWGVYPASGYFDDNSFRQVGLGVAGGGAGILPILTAAEVEFWRAERAMEDGDSEDALEHIKDGIRKSTEKVFPFAALDPNHDTDFESDEDDVDDFIDDIEEAFDSGSTDDKWNILAEQYWVVMFGNGAEAYNFYRRQGYPTTLQPNLEANPGPFPRSFPYASGEVIANPNINQKPNYNAQVFWDNNPPSSPTGGFPIAN